MYVWNQQANTHKQMEAAQCTPALQSAQGRHLYVLLDILNCSVLIQPRVQLILILIILIAYSHLMPEKLVVILPFYNMLCVICVEFSKGFPVTDKLLADLLRDRRFTSSWRCKTWKLKWTKLLIVGREIKCPIKTNIKGRISCFIINWYYNSKVLLRYLKNAEDMNYGLLNIIYIKR